ncbi:hypothetical protein [uncultured Dokdonia sp.]|uniref:hypothetical protein n=1 Tax=uncultured Dokdonia sp. TaxID=575653 RepID=UPI002623F35E|nr:hypothetical protein [uncultured Dokdonia sp.]
MSHIYGAMHYFFGVGFIVCSLFMFTNYYIGDTTTVTETYEIVDRSSMPGNKHNRSKRQPLIRIRYQKKIKELVFSYQYYKMMEFYNTVELETRKGYLGYDIIENKTLKL